MKCYLLLFILVVMSFSRPFPKCVKYLNVPVELYIITVH